MTGWSSASTEADARAEIARLRYRLETGARLVDLLLARLRNARIILPARELLTCREWIDSATHGLDDSWDQRLRTEVEACERALAERGGR